MSTPQRRVPDEILAAFRAYITDDMELWSAREAALDWSKAGRLAYRAFIVAMFAEAVRLQLGPHPREERIIEFVADVRARDDEIADLLDPDTTERLIGEVYDYTDAADIGRERAEPIRLAVIIAIIPGAHLTPAELDAFLERSRTSAEEALG